MKSAKSCLPSRAVLTVLVCCAAAGAGEKRDYVWFLRQIGNLDRLPFLEDEAVISRQFSSYHRASKYVRETGECVGMGENGDAGHKLSIHFGPEAPGEFEKFAIPPDTRRFPFGDLEWVLDPLERNHVFFLPADGIADPKTRPPENIVATIPGPGCIYRIWSADPRGKIRFYFDGRTEPLELDFKGMFEKGEFDPKADDLAARPEWPFIRPIAFRRDGAGDMKASDCYLPIPFAKSCVITLTEPSFYHFGYKTFPARTEIETFRLPLTAAEDAELSQVCRAFLERGKDPKPALPGTETIEKTAEIAPGQEIVLADLRGPRVVRAFHAKCAGNERYALSKALLTAHFDDEAKPCVWSPLINFFGTGFEPRDYRSYPLGYIGGEGYCYYPMPFRKSARFILKNEGTKPMTLSWRISHAPLDSTPENMMLFKANYRREEVCATFDYPFIECDGQGRFLGASLCIDDAWRSWWGEGDEKIWVDADVFPSFFGTGSEDFFGDAWGIRKLQETFFACSFDENIYEHSWFCCYRWFVPDDIPFRNKLKATIENYSESIWGTKVLDWDEDYVSVAYWYQKPGGTDFFEPVPVEKRRPWGKVPKPPFVEAEDVLAAEVASGAKIVEDEALPYELSRGRAIDLGIVKAGREFKFTGPETLCEGPFIVNIHTARGVENPAAFELFVNGVKVGDTPSGFGGGDLAQVGAAVLPKGRGDFTLRCSKEGRAILDCFQIEATRQFEDIVEAEKAVVVKRDGPEPVSDVGVAWSSGRQLRFPAAKDGQSIELEAEIPPGNWFVSVGLQTGPDCGDYEVFINGQPSGKINGYSPTPVVKDWLRIGKLKGTNGKTSFRFVCAGKDAKSSGRALGLDYICRQPIVVEDAIEGETACLTDVKFGTITDQKLGFQFSGGNHLWFHPSQVGAEFTWPLDVPEDGDYELSVYFTKSWDYANVRLWLDGKEIGTFDTYAPTVVWDGKKPLGRFPLKKGTSRLRFEVVGKNELSKGILVGVDCVTLIRQ